MVIGPLRCPRQNDQEDPKRRAERDQEQSADTLQPDARAFIPSLDPGSVNLVILGWCDFVLGGRRRRQNCLRIGCHTALRESKPQEHAEELSPIPIFYCLRALIRSATSR